MKLTVGQALEIRGKLTSFKKKDIPGVLAFTIARTLRPVREIAEGYDEQQAELAKKYGRPSPDQPGAFLFTNEEGKFQQDKYDGYTSEVEALLKHEVELDVSPKLDQKELEKLKLSVEEVEAFEKFV